MKFLRTDVDCVKSRRRLSSFRVSTKINIKINSVNLLSLSLSLSFLFSLSLPPPPISNGGFQIQVVIHEKILTGDVCFCVCSLAATAGRNGQVGSLQRGASSTSDTTRAGSDTQSACMIYTMTCTLYFRMLNRLLSANLFPFFFFKGLGSTKIFHRSTMAVQLLEKRKKLQPCTQGISIYDLNFLLFWPLFSFFFLFLFFFPSFLLFLTMYMVRNTSPQVLQIQRSACRGSLLQCCLCRGWL